MTFLLHVYVATVWSCIGIAFTQDISSTINSIEGNNCVPPPDFRHGRWSLVQNPMSVSYSCYNGYKLNGPSKQLCLSNGTWDPVEFPTCVESSACRRPFPENGNLRYKYGIEFDVGDVVTVVCNDQYAMSVDSQLLTELQLVCSQDRIWVTLDGWRVEPNCTIHLCDSPPDVPHSEIRFGHEDIPLSKVSQPPEGQSVYYICLSGYTLADPTADELICNNGEWQGSVPSCVSYGQCSAPEQIPFGRFFNDDSDRSLGNPYNYRVGARVTYICDDGYKLVGAATLICNREQKWSHHAPQCIPKQDPSKYCPSVSTISDGHCFCESQSDLQYCEPFYQGLHVECVCNEGYMLIGQSIVTCGTNGHWDYTMPTCVLDIEIDGGKSSPTLSPTHMSTLAIVVATACSVLGVLLLIMVIIVFRRKKPNAPRLCRPSSVPPPYSRVHSNSLDEHDRMLLIGYDNSQVALPTYDEATRPGHHMLHRGGQVGEYRQLPNIPSNFRTGQLQHGETTSRHSIITTSTMNRDGVSEIFGSIDTVNHSMSDASTAVTVETLDSATSHHSNMSQTARAGSISSSNGSLANEDAPLLDSVSRSEREPDSVSNQEDLQDKHEN